MSSPNFSIAKHTFPGQHIRHCLAGNRDKDEDVQHLEVKQYSPLDNPNPKDDDVTIIATCAISFPKEMYEPMWDDLLEHCKNYGLRIRSIWAVDASNHGASGILNEHIQGDCPSFSDLARDILNMVNIFRDQIKTPIVGFGHSMGGSVLLELSNLHPRLFASLILADPVIGPSIRNTGAVLVNASSVRPDIWSSREEADLAFRSAKGMQKWDPRCFEAWRRCGIRDTPTLLYPKPGKVTLSTPKAQEAWSYGSSYFDALPEDDCYQNPKRRIVKYPEADVTIRDTHPFYLPEAMRAWNVLPNIRPGVLYLFPDRGPMSTAEEMAEKVDRTGNGVGGSGGRHFHRVEKALIKGSGHLLAFEKPRECARAMTEWLGRDLKIWHERRTFQKQHRDDKSINMVGLSEEWMNRANGFYEAHMARSRVMAKL